MTGASKKEIQDYWSKNVPGWDIFSKKYSPEQKEFFIELDNFRFKYEQYVLPLMDSVSAKGNLILEVGCGAGADSRYMSKKGAHVVSVDLSPSNVILTTKGMKILNLNGRGICADAEKLPFKDNTFDAVYSFGVLHHTPDTKQSINELYRVLKRGGKMAVMLYHKGYAYYALLALYGWISLFMRQTSEQLMSKYDHTPLSKMYSRRAARKLFAVFGRVNLEVTTYGGIQKDRFLKYVWFALNKSKILMRHFGTFLIIKGNK
jgi:ubiquinone/menaquinone biosynthesis C-methylase UbiE